VRERESEREREREEKSVCVVFERESVWCCVVWKKKKNKKELEKGGVVSVVVHQ